MACGSEKESHDCKGSYFKKNLSTEGAVKEEPKDEAPKDKAPQTEAPQGEGTQTPETARSSV